jgi:large subunit ribosomal protein L25
MATTTLPPSESRSHESISIPTLEERATISLSASGPATSQTAIELAKTLPPSLIEFFRRFPPSDSYAIGPQRPSPLEGTPKAEEILLASTPLSDPTYNPFQTWKNPVTGRWRPPMFSLRRQAELVKKAMNYGVAELLPHTSKLPWVKAQKREEQGLRVKGTGVGQKVKGKEWERTVKGRLEKRRRAMLEMPKLVQQWKEVSFCLRKYPWIRTYANNLAERTRKRMEEVAQVRAFAVYISFLRFWSTSACIGIENGSYCIIWSIAAWQEIDSDFAYEASCIVNSCTNKTTTHLAATPCDLQDYLQIKRLFSLSDNGSETRLVPWSFRCG